MSLQSNRALTCNLCSYNSSKQMSSCFHHYCNWCLKIMQSLGYCVSCQYLRDLGGRILFGDQPDGHMSWRTEPRNFLPGNEDYGTIIISCNFDRGVQGTSFDCCFINSTIRKRILIHFGFNLYFDSKQDVLHGRYKNVYPFLPCCLD